MNLVAALVLAAGVRAVDALLPPGPPEGAEARAADDPHEIRDRLLRAVALGVVALVAREVGRRVGRAGRRR